MTILTFRNGPETHPEHNGARLIVTRGDEVVKVPPSAVEVGDLVAFRGRVLAVKREGRDAAS